jgi:hypothetical protein
MSNQKRIVYGSACMWWDGIEAASTTAGGLPCCPRCGGVLFEDDEDAWWIHVSVYNQDHPGYDAFVRWLRGRCFPSVAEAQAAFKDEGGAAGTPRES